MRPVQILVGVLAFLCVSSAYAADDTSESDAIQLDQNTEPYSPGTSESDAIQLDQNTEPNEPSDSGSDAIELDEDVQPH